MRTIARQLCSPIAAALILGATAPLAAQTLCEQLEGSWELTSEGQEGFFTVANGIVVALFAVPDRASLSEEPTTAERAQAFNEIFADAASFRCEGERVFITVLQSWIPNRVGMEFVEEVEFNGDTMRYWVLNEDGSRPEASGSARRISN